HLRPHHDVDHDRRRGLAELPRRRGETTDSELGRHDRGRSGSAGTSAARQPRPGGGDVPDGPESQPDRRPPAPAARGQGGRPVVSDEPILQVRDLSVDFLTARGRLHAIDSVDLDVRRGTTLAVVGESGSGKSVLSRTILRLLPPSAKVAPAAKILFDGEDLLALDRAAIRSVRGRRIAMVFQDPMTALNPVRTIGSQLAEGLRLHLGMMPAAAAERAVELLTTVGIASPAQRARQY